MAPIAEKLDGFRYIQARLDVLRYILETASVCRADARSGPLHSEANHPNSPQGDCAILGNVA